MSCCDNVTPILHTNFNLIKLSHVTDDESDLMKTGLLSSAMSWACCKTTSVTL